jgi:hypothetical protein
VKPVDQTKFGAPGVASPDGGFKTIVRTTHVPEGSVLRDVWIDGRLLVDESLSVIRERAKV